MRLGCQEEGFTLLEMVISLWLATVFIAVAVPTSIQIAHRAALVDTSERLLWTLRSAQTWAVGHGATATVDMNPYQPSYFVYHGMTIVAKSTFTPPVGYVDGYLRMPDHRIEYGPAGVSDVMGVISLTDGSSRTDITLYRGAGLQTISGDGAP